MYSRYTLVLLPFSESYRVYFKRQPAAEHLLKTSPFWTRLRRRALLVSLQLQVNYCIEVRIQQYDRELLKISSIKKPIVSWIYRYVSLIYY